MRQAARFNERILGFNNECNRCLKEELDRNTDIATNIPKNLETNT